MKLSVGEVLRIRERLANGETQKQIAADLGVSYWRVRDIAHGRTWNAVRVEQPRRRKRRYEPPVPA
jgi:hypothetical protein